MAMNTKTCIKILFFFKRRVYCLKTKFTRKRLTALPSFLEKSNFFPMLFPISSEVAMQYGAVSLC